jgi:hypothetical protein
MPNFKLIVKKTYVKINNMNQAMSAKKPRWEMEIIKSSMEGFH